jgi:Na+-driven multidrug efflux pump
MNTPANPKKNKWIWVLLLLPYLGLCFPALYARNTPTLMGFPFFYWYQLAWVVLASALLGLVYRKLKTN